MWFFYDYVTGEINILPSENLNKSIEITDYGFNAYSTDTDFVEINDLNKFHKIVKNYKVIDKETCNFVDIFKNKYSINKTSYVKDNKCIKLYQFVCM
jgi:hypothetical protein